MPVYLVVRLLGLATAAVFAPVRIRSVPVLENAPPKASRETFLRSAGVTLPHSAVEEVGESAASAA
jgi:hypothetical protein